MQFSSKQTLIYFFKQKETLTAMNRLGDWPKPGKRMLRNSEYQNIRADSRAQSDGQADWHIDIGTDVEDWEEYTLNLIT